MTLAEAKMILLSDADRRSDIRDAIEALPDRVLLDRLDPLSRSLVETRLHQLVTLEVAR